MKDKFNATDILSFFKNDILSYKGNVTATFSCGSSINNILPNSVVWIKTCDSTKQLIVKDSPANVFITEDDSEISNVPDNKIIIVAKKSKLLFIKILKQFFEQKKEWYIHPSSIISDKAKIHKHVFIGPNCYIGDVVVDEGCILEGNNYLYDNVFLGKNVILQAGCIIGSKAMSLSRMENGNLLNFPSLGNVIIEDDVEIGSNSVIDKAVLENTIIGKGTKINSLTFIGNSVIIGKDNYISVSVTINGSVKIGDDNFFGSSSIIRNKLTIGNNNTIGAGAVVLKNVGFNETVFGNPAKLQKNKGVKL